MAISPNLRSALFMSLAMAAFTSNDAITKGLSHEYSAAQIMFVRGIFATVFVGLLAWQQGALRGLRRALHPMVLVRTVCELGATVLFLFALAYMPLANISAVLQSLPLAVTMGAAMFLGEPVGWRRWLAILVGFAGVAIVVRPGFEGFNVYSLAALLCVAFCAARDLATRRIPDDIPSLLVSTTTAGFVTLFGLALVITLGGWTPLTLEATAAMASAAMFLIPATILLILSMRTGDISFVAPYRYTALLWAIVLGLIFYAEVPDALMLAGALLIVGSGLYSIYRETRVGRRRPIAESVTPAMAPDGT